MAGNHAVRNFKSYSTFQRLLDTAQTVFVRSCSSKGVPVVREGDTTLGCSKASKAVRTTRKPSSSFQRTVKLPHIQRKAEEWVTTPVRRLHPPVISSTVGWV